MFPFLTDFYNFHLQTSSWSEIEDSNPSLFEEAIACVAGDLCDKHGECIEKGANRYNMEKEMKEKQRKKIFKKNN